MYCCLQFQLNFIDGGSNLSKHSDDYRLTGEPFYSKTNVYEKIVSCHSAIIFS